jgi:hypothetical protein
MFLRRSRHGEEQESNVVTNNDHSRLFKTCVVPKQQRRLHYEQTKPNKTKQDPKRQSLNHTQDESNKNHGNLLLQQQLRQYV